MKCSRCKSLADELASTGPLLAAGRTASSYCSRFCFKKAWRSQEHVCKTELDLTGLLKEFRALICSEPLLTVGEEKVIMVVIHNHMMTFDIQHISLSVDCLPAACPNLRKTVVQQDLCTGTECLLLVVLAQEPKEKMEEALGLGLKVKSQVRREKVKRKAKKQWEKSISQIKKDTDGWCEYSSRVVGSKPVSSLI